MRRKQTKTKPGTVSSKRSVVRAKKVKFCFDAPEANSVTLAGNFTNWEEKPLLLKKTRKKVWEKDVNLKPGKYEYKFIVDGNWVNDPNNSNKNWNSFGTENSIVEI